MKIAEGPVELFLKAFVVGAGLTTGAFAAFVVIVVGVSLLGYEPSPIRGW